MITHRYTAQEIRACEDSLPQPIRLAMMRRVAMWTEQAISASCERLSGQTGIPANLLRQHGDVVFSVHEDGNVSVTIAQPGREPGEYAPGAFAAD